MTPVRELAPPAVEEVGDPVAGLAAALDELEALPYVDPAAALAPAEEAERAAERLGRDDLLWRARLVRADALARRGEHAESTRTCQAAREWAAAAGDDRVQARASRHLAMFYRMVGDTVSAVEHAQQCVRRLDDRAPPLVQHDHVATLAVVLAESGYLREAREWFVRAEQLAAGLDDLPRVLADRNNLAYLHLSLGEGATGLAVARGVVDLAAGALGQVDGQYLHTLAELQMATAQHAEAERTLLVVLEGHEWCPDVRVAPDPDPSLPVECLLALARLRGLQGRHGEVAALLDRAQAEVDRGYEQYAPQVLERRAESLAAQERYREAYETQKAYSRCTERLRSAQSDARARLLQAVFEVEHAQRDSRRFRELSLRDPLTDLHNRRYVDELLPGLLSAARLVGQPVALAILDLDHFKDVNDTYSHDGGDVVLRGVAQLLRAHAPEGVTVARLGGEEFVLVLPGRSAAEALAVCEDLAERLRRRRWPELGGRLRVTMSVGVASVGDTLPALLRAADERLYEAKRAGRDRVVA